MCKAKILTIISYLWVTTACAEKPFVLYNKASISAPLEINEMISDLSDAKAEMNIREQQQQLVTTVRE